MKVINASGQTLVFPDGTSVPPGGDYTLTDADKKNAAVKEWIEQEFLPDQKAAKKVEAEKAAG